MDFLTFMVVLILFAPIIAVVAIIIGVVITDIRWKKKSSYEEKLIQQCIQEKGFGLVDRIFHIASEYDVGDDFVVKTLEQVLKTSKKKKGGKHNGMDIVSCNTLR